MKKTQILSAIALAFALGVVAPIAVADNASAATIPEGTSKADFVKGEVKKLEESFGTVETYNANGTTSYNAGYAYYGTADGAITDAKGVVTTAETTQATALQAAVAGALSSNSIATTDLSSALQTALGSTAWTAHTNYSEVKAIAQSLLKFLKGQEEVKITTGKELDAENAAAATIETEIKNADDAIDAAVKTDANGKVAALVTIAEDLTGKDVDAPETVSELNSVIAIVEGKLPKIAAYRRVQEEFAKSGINADDFDADEFTERQIGQLVDNMWAAYNGTTITTPSDQIVNEATGVNAPATGIAGTAEGTATTVSIVAGLATALTALGAGVVAYRSARRK